LLPSLDDGDLVVVVKIDDLLPQHPPFIFQTFILLAAILMLQFLLTDGSQTITQLSDISLNMVQRLIDSVLLLVCLLLLLLLVVRLRRVVLRLLSWLNSSFLGLLLLPFLESLAGCLLHQ
jgi:hypothetical protein